MEFASPVWSPWLENDMQMLENIQRKAVSMISVLVWDSHEAKCKELNIGMLQVRQEKPDLQELYKMLTNTGALDPDTMLKWTDAQLGVATRSASDPLQLHAPRKRLELRSCRIME